MIRGLIPAATLLALAGCGGKLGPSGLAGTFQPVVLGQESEKKPQIIEGQTLEIGGDGRFTLRTFPLIEGTVKVEGDLVILMVEKAGGKPVPELKQESSRPFSGYPPIRLRIKDGGAKLDPDAANQNPLKFTWVRAQR